MTAKEGRKRSISALVAVGNGNGAAGFALGKAADRTTALRKAKNKVIHYLYFIERYQNHTRYGLHCHRAVITMCKLIGIEDMYAKVSGSTNLLNITRALFQGLAKQGALIPNTNKASYTTVATKWNGTGLLTFNSYNNILLVLPSLLQLLSYR
ncbi:UNVERIFIED_CONTAM: hypothetical protein FKN15_004812 [Acipenser sinensis]